MRIFFCPLSYLDDHLLLDLHKTYHRLENIMLNKNDNRCKGYINFFTISFDRKNWFISLHDRIAKELEYRFKKPKSKYIHNTPRKLDMLLGINTWTPPIKYIENDINYLKHRYRFKNKNIVYTNRELPLFLKDIKRDLELSCNTCIKKDECSFNYGKKQGGCENWCNGEITYNREYPDPITMLQIK